MLAFACSLQFSVCLGLQFRSFSFEGLASFPRIIFQCFAVSFLDSQSITFSLLIQGFQIQYLSVSLSLSLSLSLCVCFSLSLSLYVYQDSVFCQVYNLFSFSLKVMYHFQGLFFCAQVLIPQFLKFLLSNSWFIEIFCLNYLFYIFENFFPILKFLVQVHFSHFFSTICRQIHTQSTNIPPSNG